MILKTREEIEEIKKEADGTLQLYVPFGIVPKGPKELRDICVTCIYLMDRIGCGEQIESFIENENQI